MPYTPDKLQEYIANSELRVVNDCFRVRLSSELAKKYDAGAYNNAIKRYAHSIDEINALGIQYPGRANPIFYMYIVPDDDFVELLNFPFSNARYGGRPVNSYDIDGFPRAFGASQNVCENHSDCPAPIHIHINMIHEMTHLVQSMFSYSTDKIINEGFAETLPLYTLDYERQFDKHRTLISGITPDDIMSTSDLLKIPGTGKFVADPMLPGNTSASFDRFYVSSYLFVRGYITKLAQVYNQSRVAATKQFLEIMYKTTGHDEFLILDLANVINMPAKDIFGKELQLLAQSDIAKI